jgi:hypothetical protein
MSLSSRVIRAAATAAALLAATRAAAQHPSGHTAAAAVPPAAQQIAAAVLPIANEFREGATVLGYGADGRMTTLRAGNGPYVCLASDPKAPRFHVACYHRSLEPFMARGRELRAQGVTGERVDTVRFAEVKSGKLKMPDQPAALYSLTGGTFDAAAGTLNGARPLYVIYVAGQTAESTGLPARPAEGTPWIMFPGTPKAHVMFVPRMQ